jgi:hypothetical protein
MIPAKRRRKLVLTHGLITHQKIDANEALTHIPLESVSGTSAQNIKQYFALLLRFSFFRCNTTLDMKKK